MGGQPCDGGGEVRGRFQWSGGVAVGGGVTKDKGGRVRVLPSGRGNGGLPMSGWSLWGG